MSPALALTSIRQKCQFVQRRHHQRRIAEPDATADALLFTLSVTFLPLGVFIVSWCDACRRRASAELDVRRKGVAIARDVAGLFFVSGFNVHHPTFSSGVAESGLLGLHTIYWYPLRLRPAF